jgi:hypothetical protein
VNLKATPLYKKTSQQEYISSFIRKKKRWSYIGHVLKKNDQNITQQSLFCIPTGKKNRGRSKETLRRTIDRESKSINLNNIQALKNVAMQRPKWRPMGSALCAAYGSDE